MVKLIVLSFLFGSWTNFYSLAGPIISALDGIGGVLVSSVGGGSATPGALAVELDKLMDQFALFLNTIAAQATWVAGAFMVVIGTVLVAILGFLSVGAIVGAKLILTVFLGLAPVMLLASMFNVTKDYFYAWLGGLVHFALYPILVAAVFSTVLGLSSSLLGNLTGPDSAESIGQIIPFFVMLFFAKAMIVAIPLLAKMISGNIAAPAIQAIRDPGSKVNNFMRGAADTKGNQIDKQYGRQSMSQKAGEVSRTAASAGAGAIQRQFDRTKRMQQQK